MKGAIKQVAMFLVLTASISLSAQTPESQSAPTAGSQSAQAPESQSAPTSGSQSAQAPESQNAPTADEVISKYVAAIGGKEAISQVKSISMEATAQIMGNDAPVTTVIVDGVGYRTDTEFNGQKIVQCYTGKGGWSINPMGGTDASSMPDDQYNAGKGQIDIGGPLYNFAAKGGKVELIGRETSGYKIKLTSKENISFVYVLDSATYLVKSVTTSGQVMGQNVDITTTFSDYRKTEVGYQVPYSIDVDMGGQFSISMTVKNVQLNKAIDPAVFEMPKTSSQGTPPKPS